MPHLCSDVSLVWWISIFCPNTWQMLLCTAVNEGHIESAGARSKEEDLFRTLLWLAIRAEAYQKPASDGWSSMLVFYLTSSCANCPLQTFGKTVGKAPKKSIFIFPPCLPLPNGCLSQQNIVLQCHVWIFSEYQVVAITRNSPKNEALATQNPRFLDFLCFFCLLSMQELRC